MVCDIYICFEYYIPDWDKQTKILTIFSMMNHMPFTAGDKWISRNLFVMFYIFLNKRCPQVVDYKQPPSNKQTHYYCGNDFCYPEIECAFPCVVE